MPLIEFDRVGGITFAGKYSQTEFDALNPATQPAGAIYNVHPDGNPDACAGIYANIDGRFHPWPTPNPPPPPPPPPKPAGVYHVNPTTGDIIDPTGRPFYGAGVNAAIASGYTTGINDPRDLPFVFEGMDSDGTVDPWPGDTNPDGTYAGGTISSQRRWSSHHNDAVDLPDRIYALNGTVTPRARALGIKPPADHWHQIAVRPNCVTRAQSGRPAPDTTIPGYLRSIRELADNGLVVIPELHNQTAANLPPNTTDQRWTDAVAWQDAIIEHFGTDQDPTGTVWISLPNEPYERHNNDYDDYVFHLVARARATGANNIIAVPLANWSQDLAGLAGGRYDALHRRLERAGLAGNLVWEWHAYGTDYADHPPNYRYYLGRDGYETIDQQLTAARDRGYTVIVGEYGIADPPEASNAGNWKANVGAFEALTGDTYGEPLALKHRLLLLVWNATGDTTYWKTFPLGAGPAGRGHPFWDIDGTNLSKLSNLGRGHWHISHELAAHRNP